ncbi:MAG: sulfotransferase [Calothrix sp. MO_167.B12]|nr:sulfotransferase [Calothrix sp. MO_167.B12]
MYSLGEELIFIISQPRSGSTLLQHILGSHSAIHTIPEPWIMLHKVYGLRSTGIDSEYNSLYANLALKDFLGRIPNGIESYLESLRMSSLFLYRKALEGTNKKYFLDKTPRYYHIIPEIKAIFPDSKIIFLKRNPLSVLSSLIKQNGYMGIFTEDRKHDILTAPKLINRGIREFDENIAVIHYENMVEEPEHTIKGLCEKLNLNFEPNMLNYGEKIKFNNTSFVDHKSIYKHQNPVKNYTKEWVDYFDTSQLIHIAKQYIYALGEQEIHEFGYSYSELLESIDSIKCRKRTSVIPWDLMMTPRQSLTTLEDLKFRILSSLESRGFLGTFHRVLQFSRK